MLRQQLKYTIVAKYGSLNSVVLTLSVILGNLFLFIWFVVQLVLEKLYERKQEKLRQELEEQEQETTGVRKGSLGNRLTSLVHKFGRHANHSATSNISEIQLSSLPKKSVESTKSLQINCSPCVEHALHCVALVLSLTKRLESTTNTTIRN